MDEVGRRQFNVLLPSSLIRRVKIAAISGEQSLSRFVEESLEAQLAAAEAAAPETPAR